MSLNLGCGVERIETDTSTKCNPEHLGPRKIGACPDCKAKKTKVGGCPSILSLFEYMLTSISL